MKLKALLFVFFIAILPLSLFSQDGAFDTSFGGVGFILTDIYDNRDYAGHIVQQVDGKLVLLAFTSDSNNSYSVLIRYETDGDLDTSFGVDGVSETGLADYRSEVALQTNNKILIGGTDSSNYLVERFDSAGVLDPSFANNGALIPIGAASKMLILNDDSILLLGSTSNGNDFFLVLQKFLADGNVDTLFGTNGISQVQVPFENSEIQEFKIQSDGSILVLSTRGLIVNTEIIMVKFLPDGSIDTTFGTSGYSSFLLEVIENHDWTFAAFDISQNGNIIVAGSFGDCQVFYESFLARFLPNGDLDENFGSSGILVQPGNNASPFKVLIQENNRILVGENIYDCFESANLSIRRYFENGSRDYSFAIDYLFPEPDGGDFIIQADGKIVAIGTTPWFNGDENIFVGRFQNDPLSISENNLEDIVLFPNPSDGIFKVKNVSSFSSEMVYVVSDVSGKIIKQGVLNNEQSEIDLSKAQNGMYFLKTPNSALRLIKI